MRALAIRILVTGGLGLALVPTMQPFVDAATLPVSYIVGYKAGVNAQTQSAALATKYGFAPKFIYTSAMTGMAAPLTLTQLSSIKSDASVAFVQADVAVNAVDTLVTGAVAPTGARRIAAATTTTDHGAVPFSVAVIDSGVQLNHPDLNAVAGTDCVSSTNGAVDLNGHGTAVAGAIAGKNISGGDVGATSGTRIVSVRVLDQNATGTLSQVICGVNWITANAKTFNIRVANMSLILSGSNDNNCGNTNGDALHQAICSSTKNAGVVYVAAAGNGSNNLSANVPAAYPEVLTATAMSDSDGKPGGIGGAPSCMTTQYDDRYATFSSYAGTTDTVAQAHTVAAPGVCIKTTWIGSTYQTVSGTSMSAPYVAATVALCINKGSCSGTAANIVSQSVAAAKTYSVTNKTYGFTGDPQHAVSGMYFGYLVYDGAY